MNFSEREYFAPQRDSGIELYIGPVVKGKITKKYSFTISHRINGKDGGFLGIVLAAIETNDFTNFLNNINIGENSTVTVFRTDGAMILRQPMQDEYLGKTFKHLKVFSMPFNEVPSGVFETDAIDSIKRLIAYRKVQGLPLLVATGIPVESVLKEWRARVKVYSLLAAIAFLALMGLSWLVRRSTLREEKEKAKELSDANLSLKAEIVERERTQLALLKSEQRWATTLASIGDAVIASDAAGSITFMNAVAEKLTGWMFMDAVTKPVPEVFNIINEQTRIEVENPVTKVLREGMIVGLANHAILVKKDGTEVPIDHSGAPIRDADGKTMGVVLVFRDITDRKRAEEAVNRSQKMLAELIERSPFGTYIVDSGFRIAMMNASSQDGAFCNVRPVIGRDFSETMRILWPEPVAAEIIANFRHTLETGEPYYSPRFINPRHDVEIVESYEWELHRMTLPDGQHGVICYYYDSTKLIEAQDALRRSRDELELRVEERTAQSYAFDYIGVYGKIALAGGEIKFEEFFEATGQYLSIYAYSPLPGEFAAIFTDVTDRKHMEDALRQSRDELELRVEERTAQLSQAYENLQKEMSERERIEEQLRQSQKMEAIGTLAGGIAHDFNNILAAILGFTEMAAEDVADRPDVQRSLHNVLKSVTRARELVKQILAFSRKTSHARSPLSLSPIIKETVQLLRASIPATIEINLSLSASSDTVLASPVEVQQVLMNLATNASFAMQEKGGTLEVSLTDIDFIPDEPVLGTDAIPGQYIQLAVKDTGIGMSPQVMSRVFEPFFTTKEVGKGTGMGLAVVYGIVKDLQGTITVESIPGTGSTFRVLLPKVRTEYKEDQPHTVQIPGGNERILFVDDEEMLMEWGQAALERLGYQVTVSTDSTEALKTFSANPSVFDLVITDHAMPHMAGSELSSELLKIRPDIPIILCTGHSENMSREKAKDIGIKEFLTKPLNKQELAEAVRRVLDKKSEV